MPNYVDHLDLIDSNDHVVVAMLQDRETLALATENLGKINALDTKIDGVDNRLDTKIDGVESSLNAEIGSVSSALSLADTALGNRITNEIVYVPSSTLNLDNTGANDCSAILNGISTNVGLKAGTYKIASNCTINAQIVFAKGAILNVANGVTLTINGQILAGRYQIFSGDGNIVVNEGMQDFGYPEWFNDDVVKCYATFRHIKLAYKAYYISQNLELDRPNSCIEGVSYPTNWTENCSMLIFDSNSRLIIGTYNTTVINEFPRNITVKNMLISSSFNSDVVSIYGVVRPILEGLYIYTETGICGICFYRAIGALCRNIYVQSVGVSGTFYGYRFYDESGTGNIGSRSASVWLENCIYGDTNPQNGNTFGYYIGAHHSDIFMQNCEVAVANVGLAFDSLSDDYSIDFLILNCDFDSCRSHCIEIFNCTNGAISIDNCYCANAGDSISPLIYLYNSTLSLVMSNMQIITTNIAQTGISNNANIKALLNGINIRGSGTAYTSSDDTNIIAQYLDNGVPTVIPATP